MNKLQDLSLEDILIHDFMDAEWIGVDVLHEGAGFHVMGQTNSRHVCQSLCDAANKTEVLFKSKKRWKPRPNYPANYCFSYRKSWDRLIPVCRKFKDLDIDNTLYASHMNEIDSQIIDEYDIKAAHAALVEGIKWYYNQIKNNV